MMHQYIIPSPYSYREGQDEGGSTD